MRQLPDLLALLVLLASRKRTRAAMPPRPAEMCRREARGVEEHPNLSCSEYEVCLEAALRRG